MKLSKMLLEINDSHVRATVSDTKTNWSVLFSNVYKISDEKWSKNLRRDLENMNLDINNYSILVNQEETIIKTEILTFISINFNLKEIKKKFINELRKKYFSYFVVKINTRIIRKKTGKNIIYFTYELTPKNCFRKIIGEMTSSNFDANPKIESILKSNLTQLINFDRKKIFNIHVENNNLIETIIYDNEIVESKKNNLGLNYVFRNISKNMMISLKSAEIFFKNFGNIPPENIKDNRIIHVKTTETGMNYSFTKRDLSGYITKYVDHLISSMSNEFKKYLDKDLTIIISGEIVCLNGLKTYLAKCMGMMETKIYDSKVFGIRGVNTILAEGAITNMNELFFEKNKLIDSRKEINIISKRNLRKLQKEI